MNTEPTFASSTRSSAAANRGELWLFSTDSRRLALGYTIGIGLWLVVGGVLAARLGLQPIAEGADAATYRQLVTMHGLVMMFLVALPAIPGILGNSLFCTRLGVAQMVWPRAQLLAFHLYLLGGASLLVALLAQPLDTGWDFALPRSLASHSSVGWGLMGMLLCGASFATSGANMVATLIASRRGGRAWSDLPFFAWALAAAGLVQALVTPILFIALAFLFAQRAGASDVLSGPAADVRFDQWFWLWAHPAVGSSVLASIAVVGDVVEDHGARPARTSDVALLALAALTVLVFAGFGVHLLGRSGSTACELAASAEVLACGVPIAVLVVEWITILARGEARVTTALVYAASSATTLVLAALAGACYAVMPTGAHLANTSFASGVLHLLVVGCGLGALLAGLHQIWPTWFGTQVREGSGRASALLFLAGAVLAFSPLCVRGYLGQPAGSTAQVATHASWALCAVIGSAALIAALALAAWNLLRAALDARGAHQCKEPV